MPTTQLKKLGTNTTEFTATKAEQEQINMLADLGISSKVVDQGRRIFSTDGSMPYFRVCNSHEELRQIEKEAEGWADKLRAPVALALPLSIMGGTTFIPGTGPIPIYTIKAGRLFDDWGLGGNATQTRLALTVKGEVTAARNGKPTPYLTYLSEALDYAVDFTKQEQVQRLMNKAAESPHIVGLPAALEAASGRGTCQGVLMFNPDRKLDVSTNLPQFKSDDWKIYDLGRAIASETSSSRRAHGLVHQALIRALGQEESLYVSYRVEQGTRNQLLQLRKSLTDTHQKRVSVGQ